MTTDELIELLKQHPGARVVVRGYEGGVNDVKAVEVCQIKLDYWKHSTYFGSHERADWVQPDDGPLVDAVQLIGGE